MSRQTIYEGQIRDKITRNSGDSKTVLRQFSTQLFQNIQQALLEDGHLRLHQFGSFKLKWTRQRRGRNPQTGESIIIPAHPRVVFTPAKALKQQLNPEQQQAEKPPALASHLLQPTAVVVTAATASNAESEAPDASQVATKIQPEVKKSSPVPAKRRFPGSLAAAIVVAMLVLVYFFHNDSTVEQTASTHNEQQAAPSSEQPRQPQQAPTLAQPRPETRIITTAIETEVQTAATSTLEVASNTDKDTSGAWFQQRDHTLKNGDSLWRLSNKNYTNAFYWPHIYQANRHKIVNPNKLRIGRSISLPTLHGKPGQLTAADRRQIAEGYFLVYRYYKKHNKPFPYYALLGANKFDPAVIADHIYEIDEKDWENLQLASN